MLRHDVSSFIGSGLAFYECVQNHRVRDIELHLYSHGPLTVLGIQIHMARQCHDNEYGSDLILFLCFGSRTDIKMSEIRSSQARHYCRKNISLYLTK